MCVETIVVGDIAIFFSHFENESISPILFYGTSVFPAIFSGVDLGPSCSKVEPFSLLRIGKTCFWFLQL